MDPAQAKQLARSHVTKALELDDALAEAHASNGLLLGQSWDLSGAKKELQRAIELRPNYPAAYHWIAIIQGHLGKYEEAGELLARASGLDPYSRVLSMSTGANLFYLRKFDEAIKQLDKVTESHPDFATTHFWKALVYAEMRKFEEAVVEAKKAVALDNNTSNTKLTLAAVYARAGDEESATKALNEGLSERRGYISPALVALIRFRLGEKDESFRLFEEAVETRDSGLLYLRGSPGFEECESDPRWKEIEKRIGELTS
jgi:tetratricopeptide (TPR) repeat protein